MKRDAFQENEEDLQYCDADVLNAFDKNGDAKVDDKEVDLNFETYTGQVDLMDFIN
jgi:hypothetical protein